MTRDNDNNIIIRSWPRSYYTVFTWRIVPGGAIIAVWWRNGGGVGAPGGRLAADPAAARTHEVRTQSVVGKSFEGGVGDSWSWGEQRASVACRVYSACGWRRHRRLKSRVWTRRRRRRTRPGEPIERTKRLPSSSTVVRASGSLCRFRRNCRKAALPAPQARAPKKRMPTKLLFLPSVPFVFILPKAHHPRTTRLLCIIIITVVVIVIFFFFTINALHYTHTRTQSCHVCCRRILFTPYYDILLRGYILMYIIIIRSEQFRWVWFTRYQLHVAVFEPVIYICNFHASRHYHNLGVSWPDAENPNDRVSYKS